MIFSEKKLEKGAELIIFSFIVSLVTIGSFFVSLEQHGRKLQEERGFQMPEKAKSVYLTSWSSSTESFIRRTIETAQTTKINSVVIDIKDYSGNVFYETNVPEVKEYGAERIFIHDISRFIERFHEEEIAVIARLTVFQDPILAKARPDLAIKSKERDDLWTDRQGLSWIDPSSKEAWDYNIKIARDAFAKGFDEVNFDYIRFPSDGNLKDMEFPLWDKEIPKRYVIRDFFQYLRESLPGKRISADLFGLTTISYDDLGVGQILEDAFLYFDYVCPMVYPSHYAPGFQGIEKPAEHPYEVVYLSLKAARKRLDVLNQGREEPLETKLRPWLQDFNLGAVYDAEMVRKQIKATKEALKEDYRGFMLWSPRNVYTVEALNPQ